MLSTMQAFFVPEFANGGEESIPYRRFFMPQMFMRGEGNPQVFRLHAADFGDEDGEFVLMMRLGSGNSKK